jgi:hypothetical protein
MSEVLDEAAFRARTTLSTRIVGKAEAGRDLSQRSVFEPGVSNEFCLNGGEYTVRHSFHQNEVGMPRTWFPRTTKLDYLRAGRPLFGAVVQSPTGPCTPVGGTPQHAGDAHRIRVDGPQCFQKTKDRFAVDIRATTVGPTAGSASYRPQSWEHQSGCTDSPVLPIVTGLGLSHDE